MVSVFLVTGGIGRKKLILMVAGRGQEITVPGKNYYNRLERKRTKTGVEDWQGTPLYDGDGGAAKNVRGIFHPVAVLYLVPFIRQ